MLIYYIGSRGENASRQRRAEGKASGLNSLNPRVSLKGGHFEEAR